MPHAGRGVKGDWGGSWRWSGAASSSHLHPASHSEHKPLGNCLNLHASSPLCQFPSQKSSAQLSWQRGWHSTVKVPNDEWLLKPVCAYVTLFGLAISLNEDNNIAHWHGLNVLFCLSISWHGADPQALHYTVMRLTFYYISLFAF